MSTVKSCIALLAKSVMMLIKRTTFILLKFECKYKRPKMLENKLENFKTREKACEFHC